MTLTLFPQMCSNLQRTEETCFPFWRNYDSATHLPFLALLVQLCGKHSTVQTVPGLSLFSGLSLLLIFHRRVSLMQGVFANPGLGIGTSVP